MLRRWQFTIELDRKSGQPLHLQLAQAIVKEIRRGRLLPGTPLPGTRAISGELAVNRKTVISAYDELVSQGWIENVAKRGAFVSQALPILTTTEPDTNPRPAFPLPLTEVMMDGIDKSRSADSSGTNAITFSDGVPDTRLIPYDVLSRAYRHALVSSSRANKLAYGDARGTDLLREAIAEMLRMERGLNVGPENICAVRGSQMGIFLAARALVRPGDNVVFESLTYPPARAAFRSFEANVLSVSQDSSGMNIDDLERLCSRHPIRAIFTTPHHQFPTTSLLPVERRLRLMEIAAKYNIAIVEDDYDHEFHFDHKPMLPLASMDPQGRVIHIGSLSKVLAPGLRLGYIAAAPEFVNRCAAEVMMIDRQGNSLTELAVAELMMSGELKRHIRRALKIYQERRNDALAIVRSRLPDVEFDVPPGGLALWLRPKPWVDMPTLVENALAAGVRILPGSLFADGEAVQGFRLGYAHLDQAELAKGIERLRKAFAGMSAQRS